MFCPRLGLAEPLVDDGGLGVAPVFLNVARGAYEVCLLEHVSRGFVLDHRGSRDDLDLGFAVQVAHHETRGLSGETMPPPALAHAVADARLVQVVAQAVDFGDHP